MGMESIILFILVGVAAGWISGMFWEGSGFGLAVDIVIGLVGSFIGGGLLKYFGITIFGVDPAIVSAAVVAMLLSFVVMKILKKNK